MKAVVATLVWLFAAMASANSESPLAAHRLDAFIGQWQMALAADPLTFGDRGGAGRGQMECVPGPMSAWVDCTLDSSYENMGRYVLKIVLFAQGQQVGAFVTNSFGGGRMYLGSWHDNDTLVYDDAWIDPARKWPFQRVTYEFASQNQMTFEITVSRDGNLFLPHSSGTYQRISGTGL